MLLGSLGLICSPLVAQSVWSCPPAALQPRLLSSLPLLFSISEMSCQYFNCGFP